MLKHKSLRWMAILSILVAISVPLINVGYIYPTFAEHTVSAVEKDAVRLSKLLGRVILKENNWEDWISKGMMPDFIVDDISSVVDDIELYKLKFFMADGKTIYSTSINDLGRLNTHDYFHRKVSRGETFVKLVKKEKASLEGDRYKLDVVEVYVPVMRDGQFYGAFELYIDVTAKLTQLHSLLLKISIIPTAGILLFLTAMIVLMRKLERFIKQRRAAEFDLTLALEASWELTEKLESNHRALEAKTTELEMAHQQLQQTQSQMLQKEKMASIGQLAAGVAHEINNPMGFITSNLNTLKNYLDKLIGFDKKQQKVLEVGLGEQQRIEIESLRKQGRLDRVYDDLPELLSESLEGATRVKDIVLNLKTFSHVDEAQNKDVNLNECLDSTLKIVWNELKYKAQVETEYGDLPPLNCYPQQLNQVFLNMLINSAHAIDKEGVVRLRSWADKEAVFVAISDNGCGMSPDVQERIFEPFYTTKDVGKGTGLGMSIAYEIVQKHDGNIDVESREGEGTTLTVRLPFAGREKKHESAA